MTTQQLLEQAAGLHAAGQLDQAESLYLQILHDAPAHLAARQGLASLRLHQGRHAEALAECDRVLAVDPRAIQALMQKGFALQGLEQFAGALAHYDSMLAYNARFVPALYFRGDMLLKLGRPDAALASFDRVLAIDNRIADAWVARAGALLFLHRLEEALASCDRALALEPDHPQAWFGRATALDDVGRAEEALAAYDRAIALLPDYGNALSNRGVTLMKLHRFHDAAISFEKALSCSPPPPMAFGGLAGAVLFACDWEKVEALRPEVEDHVARGKSPISPGAFLGYSDDPALQQRCLTSFTRSIIPVAPPPLWRGEMFRNPKIRVAYLSADFHDHATAHLIAELFERHNRARFEIWGVGFDADDGSAIRQRLLRSFDRFENVRTMPDLQVARLLHSNHVDIIVDLKGHTLGARPGIFAHRAAPIQVNYLGYPGTMGAPWYDYILADRIVLPMEQQPFYQEKIVQLPDCYQPNDATRLLTPAPSRAQAGLPESGFVFCCFNNNWKITAPVFAVWMRLLKAVPGSLLWLLEDNPDAAANLRRAAALEGLAERLVFAPRLDVDSHLARHQLADLFLDTLPYNAHTTASDALRVGVPLVTCMGKSFPARVATSLLHAIGLAELATDNLEDYESLAVFLAQDPQRLAGLRRKLAANRPVTPLFDCVRYTTGIETAYDQMWQNWQQGQAPRGFAVELAPPA